MDSTARFSSLVEMNDVLNQATDRSAGYLAAVEVLRRTIAAESAPSYILDPDGIRLELLAEPEVRADLVTRGLVSLPAIAHVRQPWNESGEWPVSVADHLESEAWAELPRNFTEWFGEYGVVVPVFSEGRHIGAVLLPSARPFRMTPEEHAYLAAAGRMLGAALYRWRLARRDRELGALAERRTLADDLHVDLSQQVAALGLRVEKLKLDLQDGSNSSVASEVEQLQTGVGSLKRSLRNLMLGLRSDSELVEGSLVSNIKQQLDNFRMLIGIEAHLECDDNSAADAVPLTVAAQLVRVLQEALSNVRAHAEAESVVVRLATGRTRVRLEIEDDGVGYEPALVPDTRMGLRIMEERMAQIDGELTMSSGPSGGTLVIAHAPLRADRNGIEWGT